MPMSPPARKSALCVVAFALSSSIVCSWGCSSFVFLHRPDVFRLLTLLCCAICLPYTFNNLLLLVIFVVDTCVWKLF